MKVDLHRELEGIRPAIERYLEVRAEFGKQCKLSRNDVESIRFGAFVLEMDQFPAALPIIHVDGELIPVTQSQLSLHLPERPKGAHDVRTQLGRIARYIEATNIGEEYPLLTTTTYPELSRAVKRLMPFALRAVTTCLPKGQSESIADCRMDFCNRNERSYEQSRVESLVMSTEHFVDAFKDTLQ